MSSSSYLAPPVASVPTVFLHTRTTLLLTERSYSTPYQCMICLEESFDIIEFGSRYFALPGSTCLRPRATLSQRSLQPDISVTLERDEAGMHLVVRIIGTGYFSEESSRFWERTSLFQISGANPLCCSPACIWYQDLGSRLRPEVIAHTYRYRPRND
ncbi:hypothetical protein BDR07DRAFT_623471 [Suillus spraguei]|nr:hypothetical protein BDR07DRAFT_623471 [Suillus spraguei]